MSHLVTSVRLCALMFGSNYVCLYRVHQYRLKQSFHSANKGWQTTIICPVPFLFSLLYRKYFHKQYSPGICGWLYSDHHNFKHCMGKPFGRIVPFKQGKIHLNTKSDTDSRWHICKKYVLNLSSDRHNMQNMPGDPQMIHDSKLWEWITHLLLLIWPFSAFSFRVLYFISFFLAPPFMNV